jgi:hypothetical protein
MKVLGLPKVNSCASHMVYGVLRFFDPLLPPVCAGIIVASGSLNQRVETIEDEMPIIHHSFRLLPKKPDVVWYDAMSSSAESNETRAAIPENLNNYVHTGVNNARSATLSDCPFWNERNRVKHEIQTFIQKLFINTPFFKALP